MVHSGISHDHASGEYRVRRRECEEATRALGVTSLRALTVEDLPRIERLRAPLDRRARHVVTENARVLEAVEALRSGALERLGALLAASHRSLRDDYQVSVPDLDRLVALAAEAPGVFGARLTGGGLRWGDGGGGPARGIARVDGAGGRALPGADRTDAIGAGAGLSGASNAPARAG